MKNSDIKVGKLYYATRPAEDWGDIEGKQVSFDEKVIMVEVLPKPEEVICDDNEVIPLPEHLKAAEWFHVKNVVTGRVHWINTVVYNFKRVWYAAG